MFTDPTAVALQIETHRSRVAELAPAAPVRTSSRSWGRRLLHADWSARARSAVSGLRRRPDRARRSPRPAPRPVACAPSGGVLVDGRAAGIGGRSRLSR